MTDYYVEDYLEMGEEMARFETEEHYRRYPEQYQETDYNAIFYAYLRLYPGKADVIQNAIMQAQTLGVDPESYLLDIL